MASSKTFTAADTKSGVLQWSGSSITIAGSGKTLEGMLLAPKGKVLFKSSNSVLNGSIIGSTVEVNGTTSTTFSYATLVPVAEYPLPLPPASWSPPLPTST